jgi:glutamate 5-kinase
VSGQFERGEAVIIRDLAGGEIGRGLIAYSSDETAMIAGRNSAEIEAVLGYAGRAALIHRDDMALHLAE